jgi:hypothetical protein
VTLECVEPIRQWRTPWRGAIAVVAAAMLAMWIASHWTYTSLGIDRDVLEPGGTVLSRYWRVRWPGDGSLWIGGGWWREPSSPSRQIDSFDLGGVFFKPSRRPEAQSAWNRIGFWQVGFEENQRHGERWVGVPGWLPPVLLLLGFLPAWRRQ